MFIRYGQTRPRNEFNSTFPACQTCLASALLWMADVSGWRAGGSVAKAFTITLRGCSSTGDGWFDGHLVATFGSTDRELSFGPKYVPIMQTEGRSRRFDCFRALNPFFRPEGDLHVISSPVSTPLPRLWPRVMLLSCSLAFLLSDSFPILWYVDGLEGRLPHHRQCLDSGNSVLLVHPDWRQRKQIERGSKMMDCTSTRTGFRLSNLHGRADG